MQLNWITLIISSAVSKLETAEEIINELKDKSREVMRGKKDWGQQSLRELWNSIQISNISTI